MKPVRLCVKTDRKKVTEGEPQGDDVDGRLIRLARVGTGGSIKNRGQK